MSVIVAGLHNAVRLSFRHRATHAISLLDPSAEIPWLGLVSPMHQVIRMLDIEDPEQEHAPTFDQVRTILEFTAALPDDSLLLVHCHGGVRRSTAVALAVLAQKQGMTSPEHLAASLRDVCEDPVPNLLLAHHADCVLGYKGRLVDLALKIGDVSRERRHGVKVLRDPPKFR